MDRKYRHNYKEERPDIQPLLLQSAEPLQQASAVEDAATQGKKL